MDTRQAILQVAESVVNERREKPYRHAHTDEEIINDLNEGIVSGKYDGIVADTFLKNYDEIINKASQKSDAALTTYQKLQRNYDQVYKSFV